MGGRLQRVELRPGDSVVRGKTLLAAIEPSAPDLLDARTAALTRARVQAAESSIDRAQSRLEKAKTTLQWNEAELSRLTQLMPKGAISPSDFERADTDARLARDEHRSASFELDIAKFERDQAAAALLQLTMEPEKDSPGTASTLDAFLIRSPISGKILRVFQESATVVSPGTRLLEIGDPRDLEVVVDVLSVDAVKIRPGQFVWLEQWGGEHPLAGRVRLVEPAAYLKLSALGVEEQRVNVIIDIVDALNSEDSSSGLDTLGDGFRVEARIVITERRQALAVPTSALFRQAAQWAVFQIVDGRAVSRVVEIGPRNDHYAEILSGLNQGDTVIVHPSDLIQVGTRVSSQSSGESTK